MAPNPLNVRGISTCSAGDGTQRWGRDGSPPLVTVAIPVFNGERYLRQAISSVLDQSYPNLELIVSDNASTDETETICREYARSASPVRFRYFRRSRNEGAARNYNTCFLAAQGEYFKWLAADEWIESTFVEECVELLERSSRAVLASTNYVLHDEVNGSVRRLAYDQGLSDDIDWLRGLRVLRRNRGMVLPIWGLIRTSELAKTRLIRPFFGADHCLVVELALRGEFAHTTAHLTHLRTHDEAYHRLPRHNDGVPGIREARWFDPDVKERRFFAHWGQLRGYASVVKSSSGNLPGKVLLMGYIFGPLVYRWRRRLLKEWFFGIGLDGLYMHFRCLWRKALGSDASRRRPVYVLFTGGERKVKK